MKTFRQFLNLSEATAGKNTHMTHLEDQVLYGGVKGARQAINALQSMRDMLAGHTKSKHATTIKWDGAPAVFCGTDPRDGRFFVAKKGIFNKNPKVYKTSKEIKADTSGDLADKLIIALKEFSKLGIKGVVQGDLMFTGKDLEQKTIDGFDYITFQPNTIVYAIPVEQEMAKDIMKAKIGVVWHTSYAGSDFEAMTASYGVDVNAFKKVPSVWQIDASLKHDDLSGSATMTTAETAEVTAALSDAGKVFKKIAGSTLKEIERNQTLAQTLETFNNTFVRAGQTVDPKTHVDKLIKWAVAKFDKEIESRSSERGKASMEQKKKEWMNFFSTKNKKNLSLIYQLQNDLVKAKTLIINKLDELKNFDTFIRTKNGFKVTKQEGFVAIDHLGGAAFKLVDRMEFSYNNFSPDVIKGWDK